MSVSDLHEWAARGGRAQAEVDRIIGEALAGEAAKVTDLHGRQVLTGPDLELLAEWANHPGRYLFAVRYLLTHVDAVLRAMDEPGHPAGTGLVLDELRRAALVVHELTAIDR